MPEHILGLDIGASGLKAVVLARGFRGRRRIVAARRIAIAEPGGPAAALEQLFSDHAFRNLVCVTSISPSLLSFRNLKLPFRDDKKIGQTLAFALEPLIPQPLDEVLIDYRVTAKGDPSEIFAVVANRPLIDGRGELLAPHVRDTAVIDIDAVPLATLLLSKPEGPAHAVVLDIGASGTTAIFAGEGKILHIRRFPFGGESATAAIARALQLDAAAAEAAKRGRELPEAALAALAEVQNRFFVDLKNTQAFLRGLPGFDETPGRIVLTGGGALTPGLAEGLSRFFAVAVERANLRVEEGFEIEATAAASWEPAMMDQALALAARPLGRGGGFNFRQRASEAREGYGEFRGRLKKGAIVALLILLLAGLELGLEDYGARLRLAALKREIGDEYRRRVPEATRVVDPVVQLKGKIAEAKRVSAGIGDAASAVTALDLLREISTLAPPDLLISALTLDGDAVGVKGEAPNFDAVETAKKMFSNSRHVKTVTIGTTNIVKQDKGVEFDLRIILKR